MECEDFLTIPLENSDKSLMKPRIATLSQSTLPEPEIHRRFENALAFFRKRAPVVFLGTRYRFWEQHGFVQQSLAKVLTENGVPVIWLDGAGWRRYRPVKVWDSPLLKVETLTQLPGRRFGLMDAADIHLQAAQVKFHLRKYPDALVWVQGGIDERLAAQLKSIDVFAVFDDPYCHSPTGTLCTKAKLVTVQNVHAERVFSALAEKTRLILPPVDIRHLEDPSKVKTFSLPSGMPRKVMGYLGAFESAGFDLVLFEDMIRSFSDWTHLLMGKTDAVGEKFVERLKKYPNFLRLPWQPREELAGVWKALRLQTLFYRRAGVNDGAFPTKILESLHFGVPTLSTSVPKTSSLDGIIARSPFPDHLKKLVPALEASQGSGHLGELYRYFKSEMDPRLHLARVADFLAG